MKPGVRYAIAAAALFGASTPFAKLLLETVPPTTLAGLLYLGSGMGLAITRFIRRRGWVTKGGAPAEAPLTRRDWPWLGAAIVAGGIIAPVLLLVGLRSTPAATGSLLLNLEGVLTATLAWFAFHEHFDRRIALGMGAIVGGGLLLSWQSADGGFSLSWGALAICGACLGWAADNNLTRKVSAADPGEIAMWKGLVAGSLNLALGAIADHHPTPTASWLAAGLLGFLSYGVSLVFFVLALRELGTARTAAYFSMAPFVGVLLALLLMREIPTPTFWPAMALMAIGVWIHLTEKHAHSHAHEAMEHDHLHVHDEHHEHEHDAGDPPGEPHAHWHRHEPLTHSHPHTPDVHHQHRHS